MRSRDGGVVVPPVARCAEGPELLVVGAAVGGAAEGVDEVPCPGADREAFGFVDQFLEEVLGREGGVARGGRVHGGFRVRAFTCRLERIHGLTGADPSDPMHRYTLQTAVIDARLLDWLAKEL